MNQEKIGKFIVWCRKNKKLTQEQLAEKLGISKNAVSKWERGLNLPDASLMRPLCNILDISLNELFSGNKIPDDKYKEVADYNLLKALENSVFTLKDRVVFFKKKWEREHFLEIIIEMAVILFFVVYGFIKKSGLQYLFMVLGVISGVIENERKMGYVEKNSRLTTKDISKEDLKRALKSLKKARENIRRYDTKEEAIDYLVKETLLSKKECLVAYDFITKIDFRKID